MKNSGHDARVISILSEFAKTAPHGFVSLLKACMLHRITASQGSSDPVRQEL